MFVNEQHGVISYLKEKKAKEGGVSKLRMIGTGSNPGFRRVIPVFVLARWGHPKSYGYKTPYSAIVEAPERSYPLALRLPLLSFTLVRVRSKPPAHEYGVKHRVKQLKRKRGI